MAGVPKKRIEEHFGGFLSFDEDCESEDISLDGLEEELEEHKNYDILISIFSGEKQRARATMVESNLGHVEKALIQDYVEDSHSLVLLHDQIHDCDVILSQIGSLLSGFQVHIGSISSEIKSLQEKSVDIGVKLKIARSGQVCIPYSYSNMLASIGRTTNEGDEDGRERGRER